MCRLDHWWQKRDAVIYKDTNIKEERKWIKLIQMVKNKSNMMEIIKEKYELNIRGKTLSKIFNNPLEKWSHFPKKCSRKHAGRSTTMNLVLTKTSSDSLYFWNSFSVVGNTPIKDVSHYVRMGKPFQHIQEVFILPWPQVKLMLFRYGKIYNCWF